jgi:hypothetical protein
MKREKPYTWSFELTDTFGGEANYAWVKRGTIKASTPSGAIRAAKRALGITARHTADIYSDLLSLRFRDACIVLFLTPSDTLDF